MPSVDLSFKKGWQLLQCILGCYELPYNKCRYPTGQITWRGHVERHVERKNPWNYMEETKEPNNENQGHRPMMPVRWFSLLLRVWAVLVEALEVWVKKPQETSYETKANYPPYPSWTPDQRILRNNTMIIGMRQPLNFNSLFCNNW